MGIGDRGIHDRGIPLYGKCHRIKNVKILKFLYSELVFLKKKEGKCVLLLVCINKAIGKSMNIVLLNCS